MSEETERARLIEVARTFIGTKYHSNGKLKGVGVDCGTLLTLAFAEAGLRPPIELADYSSQFHVHSSEPRYERELTKNGAHEVEQPKIGDIALYFLGKQFAHGAFVSGLDPLRLIHAYAPSRRVVEGVETEFAMIASQPKKFFSAW